MYEKLSQIYDVPFIKTTSLPSQPIPPQSQEVAFFAGGSFWVLEAALGKINGVNKTSTGYLGGSYRKPSYKEVCEGGTGHTEVVKVVYDRRIVSFTSLCDLFWDTHDPTKDYLNVGLSTHQRSVVFYTTEEERKEAQKSKIRKQMTLNKRIVSKILHVGNLEFFLAENQHQKYYLQKHYRLCGSVELRSTNQFAESKIACKLNGIMGMNEERMIEELATFLEIEKLPHSAKLDCEEIVENMQAIKHK